MTVIPSAAADDALTLADVTGERKRVSQTEYGVSDRRAQH
jgi:hypothetical protein